MQIDKNKSTETMLVISTGFLVLHLVFGSQALLYVALGSGLTGIFIKPLALLIAKGWFLLGEVLGFVVSKVVLSVVFYLLLFPLALLHNLFNKNPMNLKAKGSTLWVKREHTYTANDLKNTW